jgi:propionyl-CoA carboxylase alpha chain
VTEAITGADLVMWQIAVASGLPLPLAQDELVVRGHAIEARLYGEDPAHDFLPATGLIHRFGSVPRSGLRIDAGVADGSVITPHYDPMLAKVISHAPTRELAASILSDGLARMTLHAPVTNRDSLVAILRSRSFLSGETTTSFLDEHVDLLSPVLPEADEQRHALAVAYAVAVDDAPDEAVPLGWRNVPAAPEFVTLLRRGAAEFVSVLIDRGRDGDRVRLSRSVDVPYAGVFSAPSVELPSAEAVVERLDSGVVVVARIDSVAARCAVARYGDEVFVDDGRHATAWSVSPRFADHSLDAAGHGPSTSVPGTITAVAVAAGDAVIAGQTLVMLEAMKMEHRIIADHDGVISRVLVEVGHSVDAHTVVVEFDEDEAS